MSHANAVIAVFHSHRSAERAFRALEESGYEMHKLSMIGKGAYTNQHVVGCYNISGRMKFWGQHSAFWESLWGTLSGSAAFMLPGFGPILAAGPLVAELVAKMEGAAALHSGGAIGNALASMGISENNLAPYEADLKIGKLLMIVQGTYEDFEMARLQLESAIAVVSTPSIVSEPVGV